MMVMVRSVPGYATVHTDKHTDRYTRLRTRAHPLSLSLTHMFHVVTSEFEEALAGVYDGVVWQRWV